MYEITIPSEGCSVFYGSYIDTYYNGQRTRYYLNENHLIRSSTTSSSGIPHGAVCLTQGELRYKPESEVWFTLVSILIFGAILALAVRLIIYPFWRRNV